MLSSPIVQPGGLRLRRICGEECTLGPLVVTADPASEGGGLFLLDLAALPQAALPSAKGLAALPQAALNQPFACHPHTLQTLQGCLHLISSFSNHCHLMARSDQAENHHESSIVF